MDLIESIKNRAQGALIKNDHFWPIYESHFEMFQNDKIKLLEIGVYNGGSLWTWRNYFPNAEIVGLDIDDYTFQFASPEKGITIHLGDQADPLFLQTVIDIEHNFDIIIDDGSHESHAVITSFEFLFPYLNDGGLYVIEDTGHSYWPDYDADREWNTMRTQKLNPIKKKENQQTALAFFKDLTDKVNVWAYRNNEKARKNNKTGVSDYYEKHIFSIIFYDNLLIIQKFKRPQPDKCFGKVIWYDFDGSETVKGETLIEINAWKNSQLMLDYVGSDELKKFPTKFKYVLRSNHDGITVFTDPCFDPQHKHIIDEIESSIKCAWIHEPRALNIADRRLKVVEKLMDKFDYILTYDEYLLTKYPEKAIFCVDNSTWILADQTKIYEKSKMVSMIYSWKIETQGHHMRHEIANFVKGFPGDERYSSIDLYGNGSDHPIKWKAEGLADYRYSITIENSLAKWYFTEKILDCFATGTVPIYWGASNIGDYFDIRGIITFDELDELPEILSKLSEDDYEQKLPYIKENFEWAKQYHIYEDWMYHNIYKKLLKEI